MSRKLSTILVTTLVACIIVAYVLYQKWLPMINQVWDNLLIEIRHADPLYLVLGILICLAAWWLRGWRYCFIMSGLGYDISMKKSTACIFVSQTANIVVPARLGDFVRVFIMNHEYSTKYSEGVSSLIVERVFDIVTVAGLGILAIPFVLNVNHIYIVIFLLILASGGLFFIFLMYIDKLESGNRFMQIVLTMLHEIKLVSLSTRSVLVLSVSSIVIWLLDAMVCTGVVLMFEKQIPFAVIVLAIVIGNIIKAVPLTPGGLGIYEAALTATFTLLGVPLGIALLVSVIDHLIKNVITLAGGIISIYYFGDWVVPSIKKALQAGSMGGNAPDQ